MIWLRITLCLLLCQPCIPQGIARRGAGIATAGGGGSAPTVTNSTACFAPSSSTTSQTCTTSFSPTNGRTLLVWAYHDNTSTLAVADGEGTGNSYSADLNSTGTGIRGSLFRASSISGSGTYVITVTSGSAAFTGIIIVELSATATVDASNTNAGTNPNPSGGSITTVTANTIVFGFFGDNAGAADPLTGTSTWTVAQSQGDGGSFYVGGGEYIAETSTATLNSTWTYAGNSENFVAVTVAYR